MRADDEKVTGRPQKMTSSDPFGGKVGDKHIKELAAVSKRPLRLLVVEDDHALLNLLSEFLFKRGMVVEKAANGREALEKLNSFSFDLVLADLHLPLMTGQSLLEWIKENRPQTKVVIMTGDNTPSHIINAMRSGVVDYILKPFGLPEVEEAIERCRKKIEPAQQAGLVSLIYQIMHDVRGDLMNLNMMTRLLERGHYGELDSSVGAQVSAIEKKLLSMTGMVEDYCSIALIVGRGDILAEEQLHLKNDLFGPIVDELALEIERKGLAVEAAFDLASLEQTKVFGHRVLLRGVFRTLLRNAVKNCSDEGSISYDVACNGRRFMIHIDNDGEPVPENMRPHLFDEYSNLGRHSCSFADNDDIVLGLSLARNIVRQHGGEMWYEALANGSRFALTLPAI